MGYQVVTDWLHSCRRQLPTKLRPEVVPGVIMAVPMPMQRALNRESLGLQTRAMQTDFSRYEEWYHFKVVPGYEKDRVVVYHPEDLEGAVVFRMPPIVVANIG